MLVLRCFCVRVTLRIAYAACLITDGGRSRGVAQSTLPANRMEPRTPLSAPGLNALLQKLQDHLDEFNHTIRSFECDEHIVSSRTPALHGPYPARQTSDSVFRVRRSDDKTDLNNPEKDPDNPTRHNLLHEARIVKRIDGRNEAEGTTRLDSPYVFFGIFIGGLTPVTTSAAACFHYTLHGVRQGKIIVDFASWPHHDAAHSCPYPDSMFGRAWVDPQSMQVVRMDTSTKNYEVQDGIRGTWTWSARFQPVTLGGTAYWLPASIQSDEEAENSHGVPVVGAGGHTYSDSVTYHLSATYANYHLLTSSATILPAP